MKDVQSRGTYSGKTDECSAKKVVHVETVC